MQGGVLPKESVNQTLLPGGLTQPTTPAPLSEHTSEQSMLPPLPQEKKGSHTKISHLGPSWAVQAATTEVPLQERKELTGQVHPLPERAGSPVLGCLFSSSAWGRSCREWSVRGRQPRTEPGLAWYPSSGSDQPTRILLLTWEDPLKRQTRETRYIQA